jgi:hypothetical protein
MSKFNPGINLLGDLGNVAADVLRQNTIYTTNTVGGMGGPTQTRPIGDTITPIPAVERFQEGVERRLDQVPYIGPGLGLASELAIPTSPLEIALAPTGWGAAGDVADVARLGRGAVNLSQQAAEAAARRTGQGLGSELGSMSLSGGRTNVGGSLQRQAHDLREVAPEATQEMSYLGEGIGLNPKALGIPDDVSAEMAGIKANPKGKTAQLGKLQAQADARRVLDEQSANAAHAYNTLLGMARNAGGPLPRDRAYRDELARIVNDIIDIDDDLSIAFKPDVLGSATTPSSSMTPEAVSAIRRRRKGGSEIPVTQDPMAPSRGTQAQAPVSAAPETPPASVATIDPPTSPPPPPTGTGSGGEEFAGNIRLSKYPEDIRDSIKSWADANPDVVQNARRGTIPDAQVQTMARELVNDLGGNFEKLERGWKPGQAWNAEEITAIRGALNDATKRVMEMAESARLVDSTENQLKLTEAILRQQRIQQTVHGVTAEAGRSLRAFRTQAAEALADNNVARMQELMRHALNGKGEQDITNIAEMIRALDLDDPQAVNAFLRDVNKPGMGDYLYELWINSVLSGPITHLRNIFGNAAATMYSPIERLGAVPVESVAARLTGRQSQRYWQEAPASLLGMAHGLPEGVRGAIDVLRHGFNPNDVGRLEIRRTAFTGKPGRVIRFPTNMLEAMDSFFHAVNYRSSLYGDAVRQARKEGHTDVALRNRIAELIHEPTTGMVKHSSDEAERLLFRDDPGQFATKLMSLRESTPGMKYVLPFIKTPANLLKYGVKHSPLGLFDAPMWKRVAAGNPEASDEVARTVMGSMIGTSLGAMIATGQLEITGAVPTDASERDRFYREGKLPFSVKIPGIGWTQYNQIPILDTTLTSVAAVVDGVKNGDDVTGIASNTAGIIAQSILDKSYLNGLADFFDAIADPARYAERFATRTITGFVPFSAALRQTAQSIDKTVRTPEGFEENLRAGIPGLTGTVPERLDAFGNEAQRAQPSPLQISPDRQSAVDAELERLGEEVGLVGDSIGGRKLNRDEQAAYQRMAGQFTYLLLDKAVGREEYQALEDVQKLKVVNDLVGDARDPTRKVLSAIFEDPAYDDLSDSEKRQLLDRLTARWAERIAETVGVP